MNEADLEIKPGPILAIGTFLYQLNTTEGLPKSNLWGGNLQVYNGNDPVFLERAVKLFLAAEDMLATLKQIGEYTGEGSSYTTPWRDIVREMGQMARDAVAKAEA